LQELDQQGYVCPRCKTRFTTLDAGSLLDFATNSMRCDRCGTDVVDNENIDDVKRSKDQMSRLLAQTKLIVDGLRKTESAPLAK
jgi:transcription initiation factor TFIIE subunit alpha